MKKTMGGWLEKVKVIKFNCCLQIRSLVNHGKIINTIDHQYSF